MAKHLRVKPRSRVDLGQWDPSDRGGYEDREHAAAELQKDLERLAELQERLYAGHRRALLVVLQGMDTSGKDGTIKHVFSGVNPVGCQVTSFKQPTPEELDHDFLWRVHRAAPRRGQIGIFNRSHYEDVLVVRVHNMVPRAVWKGRYDQINAFEQMLTASGTQIVKFFLHISKQEQKRRLQARLEDPEKSWKFEMSDLRERKLWGRYRAAYEDALGHCSTSWAPWTIVPADHKWYRNLVVARTIVESLEDLRLETPRPPRGLGRVTIR
jgi:PPK2 family polyphosphate:nucleotide phosphotransferase